MSWLGEVDLVRGYYYCELCRQGSFPLDVQLELKDRNWSGGLLQQMVWLSGKESSYEAAATTLERIGQVYVSDSTLWRQVDKWAASFEQAKAKQVGPTSEPQVKMGASMDGAMVQVREEGWKELKVGTVYELALRPEWDEDSQEWLDIAHAVKPSYVGYLGGPSEFGALMWQEAANRQWESHHDTQIMGDGAAWIWNLTAEHFYDSVQTVDWYHASLHLHQAATELYPDNETARTRWYHQQETKLFQGHIAPLSLELAGSTQANYFQTHQRRMNYLELREDGYLLGSGVVESTAKQFKARFCGPGMQWSRPGLQRLIPIRAAVMAHSFDLIWNQAYLNFPLN